MKNQIRQLLLVPFLALLLLSGCAKSNINPPTPPQITFAKYVTAFGDADLAAANIVAAEKANGTISAAEYATLSAIITQASNAGVAINTELASTDPWCTTNVLTPGCQQGKIVLILQNAGLSALNAKLTLTDQLIVATILTTANAISAVLGGPVL
jgi:hypothetical protein